MTYADLITTGGVFFILLAFLLTTFNLIHAKTSAYFLLNIAGGGLALYGSILIQSVPFAVLEGVWTLVAVIGLFKIKPLNA
ncbi:MAG TPA: hypothetical protein VD905_01755 [Flavobacteriales bacterium]|nr:hypothetical protein [Flavobacteriales bacterium]